MRSSLVTLLSLTLVVLAGCKEEAPPADTDASSSVDDATSEDDDADDDEEEDEAPRIVSITPDDGATLVRPDDVITVTFSEPMDGKSVQASFVSEALGEDVTFAWSEDMTELTITPTEGMPVLDVYESEAGAVVDVRIGEDAESEAGDELEEAEEVAFSVVRWSRLVFDHGASLTGRVSSNGSVSLVSLYVGDNPSDDTYEVLTSFDADVPGAYLSVHSATLELSAADVEGTPLDDLGDLNLDLVSYEKLDGAAFGLPAESSVSVPTAPPKGSEWRVDATPLVRTAFEDLASFGYRVQLRLAFATPTDEDGDSDWLWIGKGESGPRLVIDVLVE